MLQRVLVAALVLGATLPALAQTGEPFSAERSWQIQRIGAPTISPDGAMIIAPVTRFDLNDNKGLTDLWLWSSDGATRKSTSSFISYSPSAVRQT